LARPVHDRAGLVQHADRHEPASVVRQVELERFRRFAREGAPRVRRATDRLAARRRHADLELPPSGDVRTVSSSGIGCSGEARTITSPFGARRRSIDEKTCS
jgi:hypothetical protein